LELAERAAEAALDVLDKAELAALDAEEREEEALEDFAIVTLIRIGRGIRCSRFNGLRKERFRYCRTEQEAHDTCL
jgi:hypothetical protein